MRSTASDEEVERATLALEAAGLDRAAAANHFWELDGELRLLRSQINGLSGGDKELAAQISLHRDRARSAAVDAYVWAGRGSDLDHLFNSSDVQEQAVRDHFVVGRVDRASEAIDDLAQVRYGVDAELVEFAEHEADLIARHGQASLDLDRAVTAEQTATQDLEDALAKAIRLNEVKEARRREEQAEQERAAASSLAPSPAASATASSSSDGPTEEQWERLRQCESTGNYQVVSRSGKYRGAYQFDLPTWQSMGGTGDPAAAPEWEQDARAKALYELRGWRPWPHCGRHLIP